MNAKYDGGFSLEKNKPVEVGLCFEWLDTSDVRLIKCQNWQWALPSDGSGIAELVMTGITSTGASELTDAALSGADTVKTQYDTLAASADFETTDDQEITMSDPIVLNKITSSWTIV